jgi:transposase
MTTMKIRKNHTPVFKAQVVRELFKEEQTQAQVASKHGVHPNQLRQWKDIAIKGLPRLFEPGQDLAAQAASYEARINELYAEIGRLTTQVAWLKKKSGLEPDSQ